MNRDEMYMCNSYKLKELKKRLKPVEDYSSLKEGVYLFHNQDNHIFNVNKFCRYFKENNQISYTNSEGALHFMSATGWYYYDEYEADQVEEEFTPKLYIISSVKYKEDYWFMVAFNEKHLKECFIKDMRLEEDMTDLEFWERYSYEILKEVNGFNIELK